VFETVPAFVPYMPVLVVIEYVAVCIFTIEYIGRIIANYGHVRKYIFGYFGIIDLLSIIPTFFALSNFLFLKSVRVLRILRLLRMIRLAKLSRIDDEALAEPETKAHLYKMSVRIYFLALFSSVTIFGTLMYVTEGYRPEFASIPLGMIWAAKVSLGGVAQHMPDTTIGDLITIAARFSGLALFSLMISIIGGSLRWILFGTQEIDSVVSPPVRS
jgi:voltage-gated potassium channel